MGDLEVRAITDADMGDYLGCMRTGFLVDREPNQDFVAWAIDHFDLERTFAALDGSLLCGTARTFPTALTVPGGSTMPVAALTQVTVLPSHRRRGALTLMMERTLADAEARGEAAAILIASEWPIYGRFGYGPATEWASVDIDLRRVRLVEPSPAGAIELVSREELRRFAPPAFDAHRFATPGAIERDERWWDIILGVDVRPGDKPDTTEVRAVHRDRSGAVDGYAVYGAVESWRDGMSHGRIELRELITTNRSSYVDLWSYVCSIDLAATLHAWPRPIDDPLPFVFVDGRAVRHHERSDHLWVRLLDVPAALEARRYATGGALVLEVLDGRRGGPSRLRIEGGPESSSCAETSADADIVLPIGALGAAYLGGTSFAALQMGGAVLEQRAGAITLADTMFRTTPLPFLTTNF